MSRLKQVEDYATERGWEVRTETDKLKGTVFLVVSKDDKILMSEFVIGMDLNIMLKAMIKHDVGPEDAQGEFPFAKAGDLL